MLVNGEKIELKTKKSLQDFLVDEKYDPSKIAVELNGKVVPRVDFKDVQLQNSDQIEIVCFVGGG